MKDDEDKEGFEEAEDQAEGVSVESGQADFSEGSLGDDFEGGEGAEDLKEEYSTEDQENSSQLSRFKSAVSKDPKQSIIILLILVGVIGGIMYYILYSGASDIPKTTQNTILSKKTKKGKSNIQAPSLDGSSALAPSYDVAIDPVAAKQSLDKMLSEQSKKDKATAAAVKKAAVTAKANMQDTIAQPRSVPKPDFSKVVDVKSGTPDIKNESAAKIKEQTSARIKSSMFIGGAGDKKGGSSQASSRDSSVGYIVEASAAPLSKLTKVGQMSSLITQGKIIETVLETPVNTNYPGPIRALVSKDVYSEKGSNVLIARGSRVIGELVGGYQAGHTRVLIKWNRIILPSGYDIKVEGAPGVNNLGSIGVQGIVDRQLWNSLGNVALLSAINIGLAKIMEKEFNVGSNSTTSTVSPDGAQTTNSTSSPTQQAAKQALDDTSGAIKKWVTDNFTSKPYIEIDQGTIVKIFVNSDIQFPQNISTGVDILK